MRARRRADQIVGVGHIGHPVAHGLVHGVLQGAGAGRHRPDLRAQQVHAEHVGLLPLHIRLAHIDDAGQAEAGADRGRGHPVLARAGLGDDAGLAHAHGQQDLAHAVVDLVCAGMVQLVAFEIDLRPAEVLGQPLREIEGGRAAHIVGHVAVQLFMERRIGLCRGIGPVQIEDQGHEGLGHIAPAEVAEASVHVGIGVPGVGGAGRVHVSAFTALSAGPRPARRRGRPGSISRPYTPARAPRQRKRPAAARPWRPWPQPHCRG